MSVAWQFYIITLLVYFGVNLIAGWSLNLQYGVTGILNFAFIIFQSAGAYAAAVTTLGPSSAQGGYQTYILGWTLAWPLPVIIAGAAGGLLALALGWLVLRPIGRTFQGMIFLVIAVIATTVVSAQTSWLNGANGLAAIPKPLQDALGFGLVGYGWLYVGITAVVCAVIYWLIRRVTSGPYGRRLRAIRENPNTASALGINIRRETITVFVVGGVIAGVSGALLVQFIGAWAPSGWEYAESFLYLAAIVVGGVGNNAGVALGVAVVLTGIFQGVQYLPSIGSQTLIGPIQWMVVAVLLVAVLWFRPQGLLPERKTRFTDAGEGAPADVTMPAPPSEIGTEQR